MSILSDLQAAKGSQKTAHRVGRGNGSGWGKTSGRGHKGQKARSGGSIKPGFEGGQTPLYRRLPKFGFSNHDFKTRYSIISLADLNEWDGDFNPETAGAKIKLKEKRIKVLANGSIEKAINVKIHKISKAAKAAIESAGGTVEVIS